MFCCIGVFAKSRIFSSNIYNESQSKSSECRHHGLALMVMEIMNKLICEFFSLIFVTFHTFVKINILSLKEAANPSQTVGKLMEKIHM